VAGSTIRRAASGQVQESEDGRGRARRTGEKRRQTGRKEGELMAGTCKEALADGGAHCATNSWWFDLPWVNRTMQ